jgi:hypothetical protein
LIVREIRPVSGRIGLTIMIVAVDQCPTFMIVREIRPVSGRIGLTIMIEASGCWRCA